MLGELNIDLLKIQDNNFLTHSFLNCVSLHHFLSTELPHRIGPGWLIPSLSLVTFLLTYMPTEMFIGC